MKSLLPTLVLFFLTTSAWADPPTTLVRQLIQLRSEIEGLNQEIESTLKEKQGEMDLWVQKKLELQAALQKEHLRKLQLTEKNRRLQRHVKQHDNADPAGKKIFLQNLSEAESWVQSSLPYRREERLKVLHSLQQRSQQGRESTESLFAELWLFYENELKLASENEYQVIPITLPNQVEQKAEVARIGWHSLFARTPDGRIYQSQNTKDGWSLVPVEGHGDQEDITRLIKNLKNKKTSGYYELPISTAKSSPMTKRRETK